MKRILFFLSILILANCKPEVLLINKWIKDQDNKSIQLVTKNSKVISDIRIKQVNPYSLKGFGIKNTDSKSKIKFIPSDDSLRYYLIQSLGLDEVEANGFEIHQAETRVLSNIYNDSSILILNCRFSASISYSQKQWQYIDKSTILIYDDKGKLIFSKEINYASGSPKLTNDAKFICLQTAEAIDVDQEYLGFMVLNTDSGEMIKEIKPSGGSFINRPFCVENIIYIAEQLDTEVIYHIFDSEIEKEYQMILTSEEFENRRKLEIDGILIKNESGDLVKKYFDPAK